VICADTVGSLFDIAALLATQPVPKGQQVGIVTTVGGPSILCADTGEADGLAIAPLAIEPRDGDVRRHLGRMTGVMRSRLSEGAGQANGFIIGGERRSSANENQVSGRRSDAHRSEEQL
jgi:acyl-CoA synthetase (NDP forming)